MLKRLSLFLCVIVTLVFPLSVNAQERIGVGVGTGKITLDEELFPGKRYELPELNVINTGDVEAEYEVSVTYHENQPEERPPLEWFTFTPTTFTLKPGEVKNVKIALHLPLKVSPEKYFAYLEARPIRKVSEDGSTSVNVAAAAKLYFTVKPANFFQAVWYRLGSLYEQYNVWLKLAGGAVVFYALLRVVRKYINLDISLKKNSDETKHPHQKHKKDSDSTE